jgi:hypothetical protein
MRKEEIVKKNVSLVFDFLRYLTEKPEIIENIKDGSELEFLDKDSPLAETEDNVKGGEKVFLKVGHTFSVSA